MTNNIFIFCDASYNHTFKTASLSVYFSNTKKYYNRIIQKIKTSQEAELSAVLFSILLARNFRLDNIVIVYDNINIPILELKNKFICDFDYIQFLWLKRDYLDYVDFHSRLFLDNFFHHNSKIENNKTLSSFLKYPFVKKINFFILILNGKEKELIESYKNKSNINDLKKYKFGNINCIKYIYHLLNDEEKDSFFNFIIKIIPKIHNSRNFKNVDMAKLEIFVLSGFDRIKKLNKKFN